MNPVKSDGKVLPTDSDEEEGILIVKSGIMRVKGIYTNYWQILM